MTDQTPEKPGEPGPDNSGQTDVSTANAAISDPIDAATPNSAVPENTQTTGQGGKWRKGQSGNPGGRPRLEGEMRAETQRYGRAALRVLVKALRSKSERLRIVAAGMLLDRGFGKPAQALTGADGAPLIPSTVLVGLMGAAPISDALRAAQVYAEIIGNPGMDLEHVRFEPPADEVSGVPIGTAAPAPVAAPVEPVPVDLPATQEAPPWE